MKRRNAIALVMALMVALSGCGESAVSTANDDYVFTAPQVKDGVTRLGDDAVEVLFAWDPVDEADGYEVSVQSRFYTEEEYREPEYIETKENQFIATAQDYFDFRIQIRAFRVDADEKVYSEWSDYATGSTYTEEDLAKDSFYLYGDFLSEIRAGIQEGFSKEQEQNLEICYHFFHPENTYEILGYMFRDIDYDGVDELLLGENSPDGSGPVEGWDSIIYDMYTAQDGEVVHVFSGWEKNCYYLCDNGMIANEIFGGGSCRGWTYYNFKGGELEVVESVFTDEDPELHAYWRYSDEKSAGEASTLGAETTEDEAWKVINGYHYQKLDFIPFE
ncbi:MAG: hypothetical protein K6G30_13940 [Acetatifactor sp.]|nr:hypothetical protein [Acetatifactor sp.]